MVIRRLQTTYGGYDAINLFVSLQSYAVYKRKLTHGFILVLFRSTHSQIAVPFSSTDTQSDQLSNYSFFRSGVNETDLL